MKWSEVSNALQTIAKQQIAEEKQRKIIAPHDRKSEKVIKGDLEKVIEDGYQMQKLLKQLEDKGAKPLALAHCQVEKDMPLRFFVVDPHVKGWKYPLLIINPEIVTIGKPHWTNESCLWFPNRPPIKALRYDEIKATFYDIELNKHYAFFKDLHAQMFQHEVDHMEGKTIYDTLIKSGIIVP